MKRSLNKLTWLVSSLAIILLFTQCNTNEPAAVMSDRLAEVFNIASSNSINRLSIDWGSLREELTEQERTLGYESAVRMLLRTLGDNHSFYTFSGGRSISESQVRCDGNAFNFTNLPGDIGYIQVNGFSGSTSEARDLANSIQQSIQQQDVPGLKGWVVDLSNNTGGNMYPMIAGLGPFYRQEVLGHFIDPLGTDVEWGFSSNGSFVQNNTNKVVQVNAPYSLQNADTKVAVIVSNRTASSGEATLISFIGRQNTLILGTASCGLSTANSYFGLSNGDALILTISTMADRDRNAFGGKIEPDELITSNEQMMQRVIQWFDD